MEYISDTDHTVRCDHDKRPQREPWQTNCHPNMTVDIGKAVPTAKQHQASHCGGGVGCRLHKQVNNINKSTKSPGRG